MAVVIGFVTRVVEIDADKDREGARFVNIGALSFMVPRSVNSSVLPVEGQFIELHSATHWPKDGKGKARSPIEMYNGHRPVGGVS